MIIVSKMLLPLPVRSQAFGRKCAKFFFLRKQEAMTIPGMRGVAI